MALTLQVVDEHCPESWQQLTSISKELHHGDYFLEVTGWSDSVLKLVYSSSAL